MSPASRGISDSPAQRQHGVDVEAAELVAEHLETVGRQVDREVADAQLVRAEAAADVERLAAFVLEMQRLDGDAVGASSESRRGRSGRARRSP